MGEERHYPTQCTSEYCGAIKSDPDCIKCEGRARLDEFEAWAKRTGALPVDPIWCPLIYRVPEAKA
jgi:hypothetical protein